MLKAFRYSIQPTAEQTALLNQHIGSCRLVYNLALEVRTLAWQKKQKSLSVFDLNNQLPDLKKELPWIKEVNSQSLQQAITDLGKAYDNFFRGYWLLSKVQIEKG